MKKGISILLMLSFILISAPKASSADVYVSASSCVLMIANTGEVIFEKNAHQQRSMASTTKIMSSLVALENCDLNRTVKASSEDISVEGTSIGLKEGDEVSLLTLVEGMLLESGNDAANVTATLVAGGKEPFSLLMNKKAKQIGMKNSSFKNPSGLTEEGHYSTAYDMALLASYALNNEYFRWISASNSLRVSLDGVSKRTFYNHNKFLNMYDDAIGVKTGYTKAAGRCLVTAVERDGITLVCVTLRAPDDWADHKKLYDYGFSNVKVKKLRIDEKSLKAYVVNSKINSLSLNSSRQFVLPYFKEIPEYEICVCIPKFVYSPVNKGDYIGWADLLTKDGKRIDKVVLTSSGDVQKLETPKKNDGKKQSFLKEILKIK